MDRMSYNTIEQQQNNTHIMTSEQRHTINQIKSQVQKFSPWATEEATYTEMYGYPSNWVGYTLAEVKHNKVEFYVDVVINSKGNIKRGSFDKLNPVKTQ